MGGAVGELAQLQAAAGAGASGHRRPAIMATLGATGSPALGGAAGRGHLEANMAAALAVQSPSEYRRWLLTYIRHLSGEPSVKTSTLAWSKPPNGSH